MAKISFYAVALILLIFFIIAPKPKIIDQTIHHTMRVIDGKIAVRKDDGRYYYMLNKPEFMKAAEIIKKINKFMIEFIIKLKKKYLYNEQTCFDEDTFKPHDEFVPFSNSCMRQPNLLNNFKYRAVYLLVTRYRPNRLEENQPTSSDDTSWVEGKGERIALCLREQNTGNFNFIDSNLIKFVAIHELSHIAANTLDHPYYFWKVFKFLLIEANKLVGYELVNYQHNHLDYCGMRVTYNPVYDKNNKMYDEVTDITNLN